MPTPTCPSPSNHVRIVDEVAVPKVGVLRFCAAEDGCETPGEGIKQLTGDSISFGPEGLSWTGVALKSIREESGYPVPRPNRLGVRVDKSGPLIPMCKEAVDAIPLALLDHRGE